MQRGDHPVDAWKKQTVLCEHELPGTARHDPLAYLQNRTVDWLDHQLAARELLSLDPATTSLVVEHEYPKARIQDKARLAPILAGSLAFTRAIDEAAAALGLTPSPRECSIYARQGSGSAARSVFGGFVEMHAGTAPDGLDSFAEPLLDAAAWPLEVVIAVTATGEKEVGSSSGMTRSAASSPYYRAWVDGQPADLATARAAIAAKDFGALADIAEHNCLKMHAAEIGRAHV